MTATVEVAGAEQHLALIGWLLQTPGPLPRKLDPGESWNGHANPTALRDEIANVSPSGPPWDVLVHVHDAADRLYSTRLTVDKPS